MEESPQQGDAGADGVRPRASPAGASGHASLGAKPMSDAGSPSRKRSAAMEAVAGKWEDDARQRGIRRRVDEAGARGAVEQHPTPGEPVVEGDGRGASEAGGVADEGFGEDESLTGSDILEQENGVELEPARME